MTTTRANARSFHFRTSCTVSHLLFLGDPGIGFKYAAEEALPITVSGWQNRQTQRTFCPSCTPKMTTETGICAEPPRPKELWLHSPKKCPTAGTRCKCGNSSINLIMPITYVPLAGMAKLADAADLKSAGPKGLWGFKSPSRHQLKSLP